MSLQAFADDHEVSTDFKPMQQDTTTSLTLLEDTVNNIQDWVNIKRLKMNPTKTEFMLFGSWQSLNKLSTKSIVVVNEEIEAKSEIKYLGSMLDLTLSMKFVIKKKCQIASWNILKIKRIRKYLTLDACKLIVDALVISHLNYTNGILGNLHQSDLKKLQLVQNRAAKLVLQYGHRDSASQCLKDLHWLPVESRIKFNIILMTYKCIHSQGPQYLSNLLVPVTIQRTCLSSKVKQLIVPRVSRKNICSTKF